MGQEIRNPTTLVQVTVQADWVDCVSDAMRANTSTSFWLSCYKKGEPSVHGTVNISATSDNQVAFTGRDGIEIETLSNYKFNVTIPSFNNTTTQVVGTGRRSKIPKVNCLGVSPEGALFVAGSNNGILTVGETGTGNTVRELQGHLEYVNTCRFFPSGQVILSGGGDFLLKIWSALDGSNPVTMKGHVKAISDTAIVDRGRNIVSASNDGTVKLWEVASGSTIRTLGRFSDRINALALDTWDTTIPEPKQALDPKDVCTEGKIVLAAGEDGFLHGIDVRATEKVLERKAYNKAGVRSVTYAPLANHLVAYGTAEGVVEVFDLRQPTETINIFQRNAAAITSLEFTKGTTQPGLYVGTEDCGLFETSPVRVEDVTDLEVLKEYTGFDLDGPSRAGLVGNGPGIVWASRDGGLLRFPS